MNKDYTTTELAQLAGVTPGYIRQEVSGLNGKTPFPGAYRRGNTTLIPYLEAELWLQGFLEKKAERRSILTKK